MLIDKTTFELLLKQKGMTQTALSEIARVGAKTVGRIRRGEELRHSNVQKIANALGVSIESLQAPPSAELAKRAKRSGELYRYVSDLRGETLNALTLTAMRYGLPEKTILEVGPYMFTMLAELSLKRRRDRLEAWRVSALEAVENGPVRPWIAPDSIVERIDELYNAELASIECRDLSGGFEGDREAEYLQPGTFEPDHAFFAFLSELTAECGYDDPVLYEWDGVSSSSMIPGHFGPYQQTLEEFFNPENENANEFCNILDDGCVLIVGGVIPLREMPDELLRDGTGPERRDWVKPRIDAYWKNPQQRRSDIHGEEGDA